MEESRFFELDAKLEALRGRRQAEDPRIIDAFHEKLDIGWIYHDNALEGVVLSYSEIRDALDRKIISDVSLVNLYEEIRNHKAAIDFVREQDQKEREDKIRLLRPRGSESGTGITPAAPGVDELAAVRSQNG